MEQDVGQLLGRVEVKLASAQREDLLSRDFRSEPSSGRKVLERLPFDLDSPYLHLGQDLDERLLNLAVEGFELLPGDSWPELFAQLQGQIDILAGIGNDLLQGDGAHGTALLPFPATSS